MKKTLHILEVFYKIKSCLNLTLRFKLYYYYLNKTQSSYLNRTSLISSIGGIMGLCVGASMMSIVEIFWFIFMFLTL